MTTFDPADHFGIFVRKGFFDERLCDEIVNEMNVDRGEPATVYGKAVSGAIDEMTRKSRRLAPRAETVHFVKEKLWECKIEIGEYFSRKLSEVEEPQFLRYRPGDFFVAHQDGNTGLLKLDSEARLVSVVILLSHMTEAPPKAKNSYCGGTLLFHDWHTQVGDELALTREAGTLVAFRSETTHEVTPVTDGERCSIASWYR